MGVSSISRAPPCLAASIRAARTTRTVSNIVRPGAPTLTSSILFDFGGTLDADGVTWKARFARLCREERLPVRTDGFDSVFHAVDDALVGTVPSTLSFGDTVWRLAAGLARALRSNDEGVSQRIACRFLEEASRNLERNTPLLSRLSRRYHLGIVSNFYGNLATVCHDSGIGALFSVIVDSTHVGCVKPHPLMFTSALDALGVTPADAVFVGDSLARDMAGACAIGMRHIWLTGEAASHEAPCCPGDPIVRSLLELEGLLL